MLFIINIQIPDADEAKRIPTYIFSKRPRTVASSVRIISLIQNFVSSYVDASFKCQDQMLVSEVTASFSSVTNFSFLSQTSSTGLDAMSQQHFSRV